MSDAAEKFTSGPNIFTFKTNTQLLGGPESTVQACLVHSPAPSTHSLLQLNTDGTSAAAPEALGPGEGPAQRSPSGHTGDVRADPAEESKRPLSREKLRGSALGPERGAWV